MTEPISDVRLAEIRELLAGWTWHCGHREPEWIVHDLLAEVDRLRALDAPEGLNEVAADSVTPEQSAKWQALWDKTLGGPLDLPPYRHPPYPRVSDRIPRRDKPRTWDYPAGG